MERKVALVTGASRGIGRGIALALAENGYDVGVNYNSSEEQALEVCRLIEKKGAKAVCLKGNIAKLEDIHAMFDKFFQEFDHIDLLVNNAGITRFAPFLEATEEMFMELTNTDWRGAFFCSQRAARNMVEKGVKGVIINITSNHQVGCWPRANIYGPTKAALHKFTMNAALELAKYGIRMVAIAPGYTDVGKSKNPEARKKVTSRIPMGRFATPEEVGEAVVYLASDKAGYITGTCLMMDGGALLPVVADNTFV